ncbi:hypothetical protein FOMG_19949 [Fusarium oxysporum f. sp. melonis 26406]|uniref:Uncharacterized protein n=1 Tax=Fusarium oxysporum f. sp. melonis 26406 TaxID=1089452 RepID=W9Z4T2_FUSOX|nr:hypothetical protein FOMG_19949 [Fusarium oxysporum f. sp. melonis 26406]
MQLTSMEQQNENELTARRVRSSISRNDGIPGGWGIQEPIKSSKHFQRPALQSSKSESVPDTTKQLESGTQSKNKTALNLSKAEINGISSKVGALRMNGRTRASN